MQARKSDTDPAPGTNKEAAPGPVGQPLEPPFREQPLAEAPEEKRKKKRTWLLIPLAVLLVLGIYEGVKYISYSRSHVSTDNAFLTADITLVAPQVTGTVQKIAVADNQVVKKGQLLVVLDDTTYRANLEQAQANLTAAIAAQQAAEADLALSTKTSNGQLTQANGGVVSAQSGILQAQASLANANAAVSAARSQEGNMAALATSAGAAVQTAIQNRAKAVQGVSAAQAQLNSAQAALRVAQANVKSAQAHESYTETEAKRFQTLEAEGAVSKEQSDSAQQDWQTAEAALQAAQDSVTNAQANVSGMEANLQSARQGIPLADASITQARANLAAAQHQQQTSAAGVQQAIANRANMAQGISVAQGKATTAVGQQQAANTVSQVVATKQAALQQAVAHVAQTKAALAQAQLDLAHTRIYAPVDGLVGNRTINRGSLVPAGTPMYSLVESNSLYVAVNLKETQTADLRANQPAEIDVDGFPAHSFKGFLQSESPATGATFALLPPDNASGNFVKVVQRIPVRVNFDPNQPDLDKLRAGMSATVAIKTR